MRKHKFRMHSEWWPVLYQDVHKLCLMTLALLNGIVLRKGHEAPVERHSTN